MAGVVFLGLTRFTHQLGSRWGKVYYYLSAFIRPVGMLLIVIGWFAISSFKPAISFFDADWELILIALGWYKTAGPQMIFWLYCFCIVGLFVSLGFGFWAIFALGLRNSFLYRSIDDSLITHGPYGIVRHPQFLSAIGITFFSCILSTGIMWAFIPDPSWIIVNIYYNWILFTVALWILAVIEDKELSLHYGDEYVKYRSLVPRLFPN
jgi:protein-S-isoprenylcysteine O-methyltransferase Ste14